MERPTAKHRREGMRWLDGRKEHMLHITLMFI